MIPRTTVESFPSSERNLLVVRNSYAAGSREIMVGVGRVFAAKVFRGNE